ncbi:DUF6199 family natural product biosynthesis protein [Paenibacillus lentus]|uniref:DUF6199 domain-containing protein n=1 Tax=Paenibacillus lentus TaxID=1338368 RepID=A0A3S8RVX1_9BACL|nr:DUF6199 family natural product biosynthesis protein [Paenibacillus lentus]AZK46923.1 hypothetical protein EIM92_12790 [Paenibacillus lentus]
MSFAISLILIGLLTIGIGIFSFLRPTFGWRMSEGWKVKGESEPSDMYIDSVKLSGVVAIMLGSIFLIGGILNLL